MFMCHKYAHIKTNKGRVHLSYVKSYHVKGPCMHGKLWISKIGKKSILPVVISLKTRQHENKMIIY